MNCSVLIPAYNASGTIERTLRSLLDQTLPRDEYEIIVVDDASTDNTAEVVRRYPVKCVRQSHLGPATARNRGAAEAAGEILVFVDADCVADKSFVEEILRPFETDLAVAGVQGSYRSSQKELVARFVQHEIESRYQIMRRARCVDFIGSYAAAYRRDVFLKAGGFDVGYPMASGEDAELSYRLAEAGKKMVFRPQACVWHQHPSRLGRYMKVKFFRGFWRVKLYATHPGKIVKDSYTPQRLKIEVVLATTVCLGLLVTSVLAAITPHLWRYALFLTAVSLLGLLVSSLPLALSFRSAGNRGVLVIPFLALLRGIALAGGLAAGILVGIVKRRLGANPFVPRRYLRGSP